MNSGFITVILTGRRRDPFGSWGFHESMISSLIRSFRFHSSMRGYSGTLKYGRGFMPCALSFQRSVTTAVRGSSSASSFMERMACSLSLCSRERFSSIDIIAQRTDAENVKSARKSLEGAAISLPLLASHVVTPQRLSCEECEGRCGRTEIC